VRAKSRNRKKHIVDWALVVRNISVCNILSWQCTFKITK